ncbi:hypothetical protein ACFV23_08625, partial [Streptomyces sp. NPDC059627]
WRAPRARGRGPRGGGRAPPPTRDPAGPPRPPPGVGGAPAALAIDELLHPDLLDQWLRHGSPRGIRARTGDFTEPLPLDVPLAGAR